MAKDGNTKDDGMKNFISYFQSVMTIGVVSKAKTAKEAEAKSLKKIKKSELTCGVVAQTPMACTVTEQWELNLPKG